MPATNSPSSDTPRPGWRGAAGADRRTPSAARPTAPRSNATPIASTRCCSACSSRRRPAAQPTAIVALGGYGRRHLTLHSDVDVLVLFEQAIGADDERFLRGFLNPLWDLPLVVGHQVRELADFGQLETDNPEFLLALLDARRVVGDPGLYSRFLAAFHRPEAHAVDPRAAAAADRRAAREVQRHALPARAGHRRTRPARCAICWRCARSRGSPIRRCSATARPIRRASTKPRISCSASARSCISSATAIRTS